MPAIAPTENQAMLDLPPRHDDERRQQRPDRRAGIAADLEQRLGKAISSAGGEPRHARGLGMKHRRADAHHRRGHQNRLEAAGHRQRHEPHEREAHADRQRERLGMPIGIHANQRLQQRGSALKRERDQSHLKEAQP